MQMGRWGIFVDVVRMRYSELLAVPVVKGMKSEEDLWTLVTSCNINRLHPEFNEYWVWPMKWSGKLSRVSQRYALVFHVNRVFRPCLHVRSALFFSFFQGEICRQRAQSDPRSFHSWNRAWNSGRHLPPQNVVSDVPNWGYVDHGMCAMGVVMMLGGSYFPLFGAEICGDVNLPLVWGENWQSWGKCKMEGSWNPETLWKMLVNFRFFKRELSTQNGYFFRSPDLVQVSYPVWRWLGRKALRASAGYPGYQGYPKPGPPEPIGFGKLRTSWGMTTRCLGIMIMAPGTLS